MPGPSPLQEHAALSLRQYAAGDPLRVRAETHRRYEEQRIDLDAEVFARLAPPPGSRVLDAGCGPGAFLRYLRDRGHEGEIMGLDLSSAMTASARDTTATVCRGDIQHLPFAAASFDHAVARHMLYHVPHIPAALQELARVLRPGGRLVVTTNAAESLPGIAALRRDLLAAFGLAPQPSPDRRFCIENAVPLLRAVFARVTAHVLDNALRFTDPAPVVAYLVSTLPSLPPETAPLHAEMERWLRGEAAARLTARSGLWRDPKAVGIYVCQTAP